MAEKHTQLTSNYISDNFTYNALTGQIARTDRKNSGGSLDSRGYLILKIKGIQYKAHRVAWFLHYGQWPTLTIDHIDSNRTNNAISNIREVDQKTNNRERRYSRNEKTGEYGIYLDEYTKGLKKKYSISDGKITARFYTIKEAKEYREKLDKRLKIVRRQK